MPSMSSYVKEVSHVNDEQKRPLLFRFLTARLTRDVVTWALITAAAVFFAFVIAPGLRHFIDGEPPKLIEWSEFQSAEQLNDFMSRESGTRVLQGPGWWSVEVTRPVSGFGADSVPCTRVLRTLADGRTAVTRGDWRYNSDGFRVCRYPGDGH